MRKIISWIVLLIGILIMALGLAADLMGIGGEAGLGPKQIFIILLGAFILCLGIFLVLPEGRKVIDRTIQRMEELQGGSHNPRETLVNCLIMAAWFGLVTGLIEGFTLWALRRMGWLTGIYAFLGNSLEIVWISAAFDLFLFLLIGFCLGILGWMFKRTPIFSFGINIFTFLALFDVLVLLLHRWVNIFGLIILSAGLAIWPARWLILKQKNSLIFWRRSLPWVVGIGFIAFVAIQGGFWLHEEIAVSNLPKTKEGSPNIIVIVVDALRADHLSSYGYERQTSPNIDHLASEGVLFENAYSTSSWTPPAHASIFTGRNVYEHGADLKPLDDRYPTISEEMQKLGYRTGAFIGNYEGISEADGYARGFEHYEDDYRSLGSMVYGTLYGRIFIYEGLHLTLGMQYKPGRKLASDIDTSILDWISQHLEHPSFTFINYFDVHAPYIPPQPYRSKFSSVDNPGGLINTDWDMDHIYVLSTPEQLQEEIDAYDGAIAYVDDSVGRLMNDLQTRGLAENTILVILSDHGESFGNHGLLEHHNSLYQEVIHVPMIFWGPKYFTGGKRITTPVSITSIPATIMNLTKNDRRSIFPGQSLSSLWEESTTNIEWPDPIAEVAQADWLPDQHLPKYGDMRAMITPLWHYIEHKTLGEELFNLVNDPAEQINLINQPGLEGVVTQFRDYFYKLLVENIE